MDLESRLTVLGNVREVIIDEPHAAAYHFPDTKMAYLCWKKPSTFDQYKEVFLKILEKNKIQRNSYFLSDIRDQGTSSPEKKEWFKEVVLKEAIESGLKKGAVIVDNNPFKQFYMNLILGATNTMGLPFKTFKEIDEAKAWLVD